MTNEELRKLSSADLLKKIEESKRKGTSACTVYRPYKTGNISEIVKYEF